MRKDTTFPRFIVNKRNCELVNKIIALLAEESISIRESDSILQYVQWKIESDSHVQNVPFNVSEIED